MALTVVTANVNGIRAASRRGGLRWLADAGADVVCLQEVRATHEQLHEALAESDLRDWHVAHAPAPQLGRAGVAVLTREQPSAIRTETGLDGIDGLGRWIEVDLASELGPLTVVSAYVHTGEADTPKQADKYAFLDAMDVRLDRLRASVARAKGHALVCGDLNVAHREVDIKNWRGNRGKAGFLEEERAHFDRWLVEALGRPRSRPWGRGSGPVHVVVLAREGLRHRRRLADRLRAGHGTPRRPLHVCRRRQGGDLRRAVERPRPADRHVRLSRRRPRSAAGGQQPDDRAASTALMSVVHAEGAVDGE